MTSPAEEFRRILVRLPRHEPPAIPLELLLCRLEQARRRTFAVVAATIAAGLIVAVTLRADPPAAPVHLQLHLVHVDAAAPNSDVPPGFDRP